jgi:hypothetical protein
MAGLGDSGSGEGWSVEACERLPLQRFNPATFQHLDMNTRPHISLEPATQLALFLSNRPGALAKVCEELAKAEVNIHALSISDTVDHSIVRMVVSDTTKALMLLGEGGMIALEAEVLMIESDNVPGTLATIAEHLAKAGVNIEYAYLATNVRSNTGLMILRPSNMESAQAVLREL